MASKRKRTSRKRKYSKKNPASFGVSLKSRKRKDTAANSQVQKILYQNQQKGGFIGAILAATAPLWLPLAVKGVKKYFIKMVNEFVLIEGGRGGGGDITDLRQSAMCRLKVKYLRYYTRYVDGLYQSFTKCCKEYSRNNVSQQSRSVISIFEIPSSILTWTDFDEAIVNGIHLPGTNVHEMLDCLFHDWQKFPKQSPPQGLYKLIPVEFQNGFDAQNVVNRRLKVFSYANEVCKRPSLVKKKQRAMRRQGIKWSIY